MMSAKYILDNLDLSNPRYHGTAWLILRLEGETIIYVKEERPEKIYQWLFSQDRLFKERMDSILKKRF